jgi:hypothetical protein
MAGERGLSIDLCRDVIAPCGDLVAAAALAAVPTIFTRYVYNSGYVDGITRPDRVGRPTS